MSTRKWHKKCFVPGCSSNSFDEPSKPFIKLPQGSAIRKKWAEAVGRKGKEVHFNAVSSVYCCGDHFQLEEDAQNWMKYKIMGDSIKLKPGILPQHSKTENGDPSLLDKPCKTEQTDEEYDGLLPHNKPYSHTDEYNIEIKHEPLLNIVKAEPPTEPSVEEIFFQAVPDSDSEMFVDNLKTELEDPISDEIFQDDITRSEHGSCSHKDIQCNIKTRKHVRSKAIQVNMNVLTHTRATSPIIFEKKRKT